MAAVDILNKIIANDGSCSGWATKTTCTICPLSRLKARPDGSYLSCIEAIGADTLPELEADAMYIEAAKKALLELAVDNLLSEDDSGDKQ
jgi:hypothetical protein